MLPVSSSSDVASRLLSRDQLQPCLRQPTQKTLLGGVVLAEFLQCGLEFRNLLLAAAMTLLTMLLLAPLIGLMPQATLAAVVIVYSLGLIKPKEFREILRIRRTEFLWAVVAFAAVMLLGTLKGIIVAIIVSLIAVAYQVADPPVYVLARKPGTNVFRPRSSEYPDDETFPGLLLVRVEGRIFFANAEQSGCA